MKDTTLAMNWDSLFAFELTNFFFTNAGEPPTAFTSWIRMFENYLLAISDTEVSEERKPALLIQSLGVEGQHICYTFPLNDKYETAIIALKEFFVFKVNLVAKRYKFCQCEQKLGESI